MRNKIFTRIIITTLLCTFLTFSVGKVTRVSAVGTTAAIAGTAFILTGAIYVSYLALTQGEMVLPAAEDMHNWLGSIGRKVAQYPSGAYAYQEMYQGLIRDPIANVIDGVWTWTQDRLKAFANDFSDTRIISEIVSHIDYVDTSNVAYNGFDYANQVVVPNVVYFNSHQYSFSEFESLGFDIQSYTGPKFVYKTGTSQIFQSTTLDVDVRNLLTTQNTYIPQFYINGAWATSPDQTVYWGIPVFDRGAFAGTLVPSSNLQYYTFTRSTYSVSFQSSYAYPLFPQAVIHDEATDRDLPMVIPDSERLQLPSWVDPYNNNRPIIPWVPIPQLPANIPTPSGYNGVSQWGFNLQDLLDKLEDLAGQLIDIGGIAGLINEFAGLHGDNYYIEYNDGDTNYYTYYQPTIYDNDTEYVTYNYDITDEQDKIPVDLNTIQLYTNNRYLAQIKESAINGSTMLRDLAVFWYDVDPEVTYIVFGCCILILIGAFTGKLGHS